MTAEQASCMRILALGAHPDDIEAGCGGTLIKYAQNGHRIFLMVMTSGGQGASPKVRKREQLQAVQRLRAEKIYWGGYPDTEVPLDREVIQKIERVVNEIKPHFIFVNYHDDTHQDHRHLALSTITATRYTKNVLFYEGPTTQNFAPDGLCGYRYGARGKDCIDQGACLAGEENQYRRTQYCRCDQIGGAFSWHSGTHEKRGRLYSLTALH